MGGEMTQALNAHMNNKTIKIKKKKYFSARCQWLMPVTQEAEIRKITV
jgi:hypothetical protein